MEYVRTKIVLDANTMLRRRENDNMYMLQANSSDAYMDISSLPVPPQQCTN